MRLGQASCSSWSLPAVSLLAVAVVTGLAPGTGDAGPYDPMPPTPPLSTEVTYGDTGKLYSGNTLVSPSAHRATPSDFGDQGRAPTINPDGSPRNCLVSRYDGITYTRCDSRSPEPPAGAVSITAPVLHLAPGISLIHRKTPPKASD